MNVQKILARIKKALSYGDRLHPERDWLMLISIAGILFVASIGWNVLLFFQFQNGKNVTAQTAPQVQKSLGDSISQVQDLFQSHAAEEVNYQQTYHFVDPSLPGS